MIDELPQKSRVLAITRVGEKLHSNDFPNWGRHLLWSRLEGPVVARAAEASPGDLLDLTLADGHIQAETVSSRPRDGD